MRIHIVFFFLRALISTYYKSTWEQITTKFLHFFYKNALILGLESNIFFLNFNHTF